MAFLICATVCFTSHLETKLKRVYRSSIVLVFLAATIVGCASSGSTSAGSEKFANLLVIGVAGSLDSRAQFERVVVSGLRAEGLDAQRYSLIFNDEPPARDNVLEAVEQHGFDAVIVTRVLSTESHVEMHGAVADTKVTRKGGGFMSLFRYDYEELDDPLDPTVNLEVEFVTELYSAASEELVWSFETKAPNSDNVPTLIDESAKLVVKKLRRSGKLATR